MSKDADDKRYTDKETQEMKAIVIEHKVFWTTLSIELPDKEGQRVKVGMSVALVGTDAEEHIPGDKSGKSAAFEKLNRLAKWLTSEAKPEVRFDIRRHDNVVFYLPEDLKTKRENYAVVIRILHSEQFDLPMDKNQLETLQNIERKLKEIDSPKEHWKERKSSL